LSRIVCRVPATSAAGPAPIAAISSEPLNVAEPKPTGSGAGRVFAVFVVLLLIAAAFYAGARYKKKIPFLASQPPAPTQTAAPVNTPAPEEPFVKFERERR